MSREDKLKLVSLDDVIELEPDLTAEPSPDPLDVFRGGVSIPPSGSLQTAGGETANPEEAPAVTANFIRRTSHV